MSYIVLRKLYGITLLLLGCIHTGLNAPCVGTEFAGPSDVNDVNVLSPDQSDANTTTLLANTLYTIPCCGVISQWNVAAEGAGRIRLQVWRKVPGSTNQYIFLGNNGWTKTSLDERVVTRSITASSRIQVDTGDIIAIYHFGAAIVRYATCDPGTTSPSVCAESVYRTPDIPGSEIAPGDAYPFNTLQSAYLGSTFVRNYAMQAVLSTKPQATCSDEDIYISDTFLPGSHVKNVRTENVDLYSSGSVFTIQSMVPDIPLAINSQTGQITTTKLLTPNYPSSTYILTIHVTDACGQSNTCVITLAVTNDAQPVRFTNLPTSTEVLRIPDIAVHIYTVKISRQRDFDETACEIQSTSPVLSHVTFSLQNKSQTEYSVVMATDPGIAKSEEPSVTLTLHCWNDQGYSNTSTLIVLFTPGTSLSNRFWIVGFLIAFIVVAVLTMLGVILCATRGIRKKQPRDTIIKRRQVKPDLIPAPIYREPVRTSFSTVNKLQSHHTVTRDRGLSQTTYTGYETSPIGSIGSDVTPVSITSIGWVESLNEEGNKQPPFSSNRKSNSVFKFDQHNLTNYHFPKKPWKP